MTNYPKTVILTRPLKQARAFATELEAAAPGRFDIMTAPLLEICPVSASVDPAVAQAVLFTSVNGVEQAIAQFSDLPGKALCVGDKCARAAQSLGFSALSAAGAVSDLIALAAREYRTEAPPMLHLRGRHSTGDLAQTLTLRGLPTEQAVIYDQHALPFPEDMRAKCAGRAVILPIFSPRTAVILAQQTAGWDLSLATAICLSPGVARKLENWNPDQIVTVQNPTAQEMLNAILST